MEYETETHTLSEKVVVTTASPRTNNKKRTKKIKIIVGAIIVVVTAIIYYIFTHGLPFIPSYPTTLPAQLQEGRFGSVAIVNDVKIPRTRYNDALAAVAEMYSQNGADLEDEVVLTQIKKTALQTVIDNEVLLQAAHEANITVDDENVDQQMLSVSIQLGGDEKLEKLTEELEKIGISMEKYRQSVKNQMLLNEFINQQVGTSTIEVSDVDAYSFYKDYIKNLPEGMTAPSYTESKTDIVKYIQGQAQQEKIINLIATLHDAAEIKELIVISDDTPTAGEAASSTEINTETTE